MDRQIVLRVKGNSYPIEFPNIGKFQMIETMKQIVSKGMYQALLQTSTISSIEVLDMIDLESYLTVLAPQLIKDLKCDSFGDLDIEDYQELKKCYKEQLVPWWNGIIDLLSPQNKK
jgi:hypothetical protein